MTTKRTDPAFLRRIFIILGATAFVLTGISGKHFHSIMGPFQIKFRRLESCPGVNTEMNFALRDVRTHYSQKYPIYSGNFTRAFALNDLLSMRLTLASWSSMGGWKENAHVAEQKRACHVLNTMLKGIWNPLMIAIYGEPVLCPLLPGISRFENYTVEAKEAALPMKVFFYGRWRADAKMLYSNGQLAACLRVFGDTIPI